MTSLKKPVISILVAAVLWFFMFSPWTGGLVNFWVAMSASAIILTTMVLVFSRPMPGFHCSRPLEQLVAGLVIAFSLWGVFWVGDKLSQLMFDFARGQVNLVYSMKEGSNAGLIAVLLLFLIGPAEEFFWRGYIQKTLARIFSPNAAFLITALVYALVHVWSFNFMLVMAALVAGAVWGLIYRIRPSLLPALIVSHAVWDALVFVILPI